MFNFIKNVYRWIVERLRELFSGWRKFYNLHVLRRKYLRYGKCKGCGRCCRGIYVRHERGIINSEEEFEKLKSRHFFYSYLNITGKDDIGLTFECTKLDKEKGKCTVHRHRALICRQYPQEEIFMMGGTLGEHCGYKFMPIRSFDHVFSKVQKSYKKDQSSF